MACHGFLFLNKIYNQLSTNCIASLFVAVKCVLKTVVADLGT